MVSSPARRLPLPAGALSPALVYKSPPGRYAYDWTGIYFGADGGFGWTTLPRERCWTLSGTPLTPFSYRVNGPVAGLFVGGNYQINKIVLGCRRRLAMVQSDSATTKYLRRSAPPALFRRGPFTISTTVKDYASVRGRLGLAFDRFLVFGTGGWAWGNPLTSYALVGDAPFFNNGGSSTGWTAGLGVDYAFTDSVIGRIEYRYTSLDTSGFVSAATQFSSGVRSSADQRFARGHRVQDWWALRHGQILRPHWFGTASGFPLR